VGDGEAIRSIPVADVHPRHGQPRQHFDDAALGQLAESIRAAGLMQPILVRTRRQGGFEIIAGERRWRAARSLGMQAIPGIVRDLGDEACAEWSLIENLQREDLNPIERAEAFQKLIEDFRLSHQDVAARVGLDRSSVSNHLRLNELDDECKSALRAGGLSMGHAKALLSITNIERRQSIARRAIQERWSVRQLEGAARLSSGAARPSAATPSAAAPMNAQLADLQRRLGEHLGTKVGIRPGRKKGSGKLIIEFFDLDQFEGLMQSLQFPLDA
jgi:ParB family chromosome partitioning protein